VNQPDHRSQHCAGSGLRAAFACDPANSPGRLHEEPDAVGRNLFQRDRDRVIHSTAFRRLKHKTQVFVYHEGDHYRTRLTHSLEVAQIARTIARNLGLDEDLTEALALAHDLGHTAFGHAGEEALDQCMRRYGGFDHNAQTIRIVTRLERRYAMFDGLNPSFETIEGLIKHNGPLTGRSGAFPQDAEFPGVVVDTAGIYGIALDTQPSAEAQVAAISDDIAYNSHDIDDGLRAQLFDIIDLGDVPLAGTALRQVLELYPDLDRTRLVHETVRRVTSAMVEDVLSEARRRIARHRPQSVDDVRALEVPLVTFSRQMHVDNAALKDFLAQRVYRNPRVAEVMDRAKRLTRDLFEAFMHDQRALPKEWQSPEDVADIGQRARHIADFIAGMTDRYAIDCHKRLFDLEPQFR